MRLLLLPILVALAGPAVTPAGAQTPATPPASPPSAAAAAAAANVPSPSPDYVYAPDGRRDPFVSLITRTVEKVERPVAKERPDGVAGVGVDEIVIRGLVESRGGWLAMIGAPSGKTYSIRVGDRLLDGNVRTITADSVLLVQEVASASASPKQREVRKYLRGDAK
jgi:Tfp pilus assembly protein PilP